MYEMNTLLRCFRTIAIVFTMGVFTTPLYSKDIKISVTPDDAKIYVDGVYMGDGTITASMRKKEGFISIKCERPGYVTLETRIYYKDKRTAVTYTLRKDPFFDISKSTDLVNKYFTVKVSKDLYTETPDGKRNTSLAWKEIHNILLNYFDEIQTTDMASGFIQTPWKYKSFPDADRQVRTRVSIRETNFGGDLSFQIKISSEAASINALHRDEDFQPIDRILKDMEPLISEFQSRLGK